MFRTPAAVLEACRAALRPGGLILCLNHNVESVSAHLMRERSPIIDIEHTYLYSPATMRRIFKAGGFKVLRQGSVSNKYSLGYITHLVPLPRRAKGLALGVLARESHRQTDGPCAARQPVSHRIAAVGPPPARTT